MAKFAGIELTNTGLSMLSKATGAGSKLTFTCFKLGSGQLADTDNTKTFTDLKEPLLTAQVHGLKDQGNGLVDISAIVSNSAVNTGFFVREVGIFAKLDDGAEQLYAYANCGNYADYIPDKTEPVDENEICVSLIVAEAQNITAIINNSIVYATQKQLQDSIVVHNTDTGAHKDIRDLVANGNIQVQSAVATHNTDAAAHSDIRAAIKNIDLSPYAKLISPSFIGSPTVPTSSPFDADTQIANSASIMQAANCVRNATYHSNSYTLTTADNGCLVGFSGSGVTATLPVPTNNSKYYIVNMDATNNLTIVSSANIFSAKYGWGTTTISIPPKTTVCVADSSYHTWIIYASDTTASKTGSTALTSSAFYDANSGFLMQWGVATIHYGAGTTITFPLAFSALYNANAIGTSTAESSKIPIVLLSSNATNMVLYTNMDGQTACWQATGKA